MTPNIGVVIPFYYLSDNFEADIKMLQKTIISTEPFARKIIVVDDGTNLPTLHNTQLIKHNSNLGKGATIRTGLEYLLSDENIHFIVEVDADNDHNPKEIVKFFEAFKNRRSNDNYLVIGDRYSAPQMINPGHYRESINNIQTLLFSQFGLKLRDSVSGFRGYSRNFANIILQNSKSQGFGIATEEIILAYLTDTTVKEIPLDYAKARKSFTKAYKLAEVLDGILIHETSLKQKGHSELVESLKIVKMQIEERTNPICFKIGGKEFNYKYSNNSYMTD